MILPSLEPLEILDNAAYSPRDLKCARCGGMTLNSPWPDNSTHPRHRPRCPYCGSNMTYPLAPLIYPTDKDRQEAIQTFEHLIQRTHNARERELYEHTLERTRRAQVRECLARPLPSLGPFIKTV